MNIPPKPEGATWTDDQWKAIMASGQNILVAAAAGSGKTAVLVERMINKILSDDPINVDELLVVTFTNASAAEMRHRIGEALEKAINKNPTSQHLRKQLALLNRASISTLHSFCLEVIRKYYYLIDIDPGFRIANETEGQLLRDEVLEELLEEEYGKENNQAFFDLVDTFSNDRSDIAVQNIIQDLYDFARSNPSPDRYLQSIVGMYDVKKGSSLEELPFIQNLLLDIELQLEGVQELLQQGLDLTKLPGGPSPRAENFLGDLHIVETLIQAKKDSWATLYEAMQSWSFSRAKVCKGDEYDKELVEQAQKLREKAKKTLQELQGELFSRKPESFIRDMQEMKIHIETLVSLVRAFSNRFLQMKNEKGLVDFADLEHYCLEILSDPNARIEGVLKPSEAAENYRKHFKEVLIDEYQDVNLVQESILQLVTQDTEQFGNMFMVGDVKQSIYRFRLAEPNLFLGKYNRFSVNGMQTGLRIDLSRNFRSRKEVLAGTNFLFKQIMGVKVGEIAYDEAAELIKGASYPEEVTYPVELLLINQEDTDKEDLEEDIAEIEFSDAELEQSQLEARVIAAKIKEMIAGQKEVYNAKTNTHRAMKYKDIVILLRSMTWAPQIMEEFKQQGIPIYADLSTGYFEATEVAIMMSLLKVIDNPYQEIPLVSVLRSPIVGLNEEDLAKIRIYQKKGSYYEALSIFCKRKQEKDSELYSKVKPFYLQLNEWRSMARQGSLAELIWQLYRDTHFYDFVGGMPGGKQRQANLRALYDRARQYESTSFRGLFRFLRFVERMMDRGDDLGAARALTEQEDVVRIMTIHSSKGLEFPTVFIAGLGRNFNTMDLKKSYLLDKEFGFASKYVNANLRISYPSLPQIAFKRKKKLELLAEEMRVLYVALTRAKERLFLIGTVKNAEKTLKKWSKVMEHREWLIKEFDRVGANSYLDWIGPSLIRHQDCEELRLEGEINPTIPDELTRHSSCWKVKILTSGEVALLESLDEIEQDDIIEKVFKYKDVPIVSNYKQQIEDRLKWIYPYNSAGKYRSKQSVSEIKRQRELNNEDSGTDLIRKIKKPLLNRPRFMQEKELNPAEIGTAMHMVMQQMDLNKPINEMAVINQLNEMVYKEFLTKEQQAVIKPEAIVQFFQTDLGLRVLNARNLVREIPFSLNLPASQVYDNWNGVDEPVLIQGIIDCYFEDEHGSVLLDYKTDGIHDRFKGGFQEAKEVLESRYRTQVNLYTEALEKILKRKIDERYLFFFDGAHVLKLEK